MAEPLYETSLLSRYFGTVWRILTRPGEFFRQMPREGGLSHPLAFALITHWIGAAFGYLWHALLRGYFETQVQGLFKVATDVIEIDTPGRAQQWMEMRDRLMHWFWGAGSVIADPFLTLFGVLFTSVLVYVGARIFVTPGRNGAPREITFETALRIVCFGMAPAILAGFPLLGGLMAGLLVLIVTVMGAKEVYRIDTGRAVIVALFPKLLFLGTILVGMAFFFVVVIKLLASAF